MSIQLPRFLAAFKPTHISLDLGALRGSGTGKVAGPTPVTDVFINGEEYYPEADREEVYGGPPPEAPTGGGQVATVRRGSRGESVRQLQQQLSAAGFNAGAADGIFGPNTEKAVRDFQRAKGLTVDGIAGPKTWGALGKSDVNTVGVRKLQQELQKAGFNPGGVDGEFGPNTEKAVKAFQKAKGLEADGIVGPKTWEALGVKTDRVLRRKAPGSAGSVNTPDGPMVYRQGKLISPKIAGKFDQMAAAAGRAGINLQIGNSYRSYQEQVVLWNKYGRDPRRVARPGHSNHQTGTAIDFVNTPGAYAWLKANASKFGLHNYPPEPWHYSLTGG